MFSTIALSVLAWAHSVSAQQGASHQALGPLNYYAQGVQPNYTYTNAMVQWLEVPLNTSIPEPTWDTDYGAQYGRQMPPPEFLQPTLDRALKEFRPKYGYLELNGTRIASGSEIMMDLCRRWSTGFRKYYNLVYFDCAPPFTGDVTGASLIAGNISVGFVARELKPIEVIDFHTKYSYTPACVPVSGGTWRHYAWLDAPAVMTHPSNPIQGLTFKQFDSIFSTTRFRGGPPIRKWGQIPGFPQNHTLANQTIVIYGNAVWNGFEEFMRDKILNVYPSSNEQPLNNEPALGDFNIFTNSSSYKRGQWRSAYSNSSDFFVGGVPAERMNQTADPDVHWLRLVFDLAKAVSTAPNAIGYTGMAYIDSPVKILPLSVSDSGPFVGAGYTQVAQGHYPLSRVTYANVNKAPGKALEPILAEFLAYIGSREGQQVVLDQAIYTPLQQWQVTAGQKRWQ